MIIARKTHFSRLHLAAVVAENLSAQMDIATLDQRQRCNRRMTVTTQGLQKLPFRPNRIGRGRVIDGCQQRRKIDARTQLIDTDSSLRCGRQQVIDGNRMAGVMHAQSFQPCGCQQRGIGLARLYPRQTGGNIAA